MQWPKLVRWLEPSIAEPEATSVCVRPQPRRRHEHRVQSSSSGRGQRSVHVRLPAMRRHAVGRLVPSLERVPPRAQPRHRDARSGVREAGIPLQARRRDDAHRLARTGARRQRGARRRAGRVRHVLDGAPPSESGAAQHGRQDARPERGHRSPASVLRGVLVESDRRQLQRQLQQQQQEAVAAGTKVVGWICWFGSVLSCHRLR